MAAKGRDAADGGGRRVAAVGGLIRYATFVFLVTKLAVKRPR